jgi:hypothetical protein
MYKAYQAQLLQLFPSQQVQQEKESDSSSSASTADVAQTTLEEPHLHGMMMSNLMQIQAAGQQTDTEATLTQADAKTEEVGQEVQAKGDWQEKADTNTVGSESIQLKCASCAAGDSVQVPESELQQHDSNSSATEVQLAAKGEKASESQIQQVAATGFSGSSTSLPHLNQIQQSFGVDLSGVQAYIGGGAATACQQMGAAAYASGDRIAFKEQPSLELAAHEAAPVVQEASGKVQLAGGVGQVGDEYENHADAVAAKVVAGQKVDRLLLPYQDTNSQDANNFQAKQQEKNIDKPITQLSATRGNYPIQLYQDITNNRQQRFRLSDDSSMLVRQEGYGSQDLWAAPGKVRDSNKTLISIGSGVLLHENQAAPDISVPTLDGQRKTLKRVRAENRNHANMCIENMYIWADCGRAARQVIGRNQGTRGVYKDPANGGRNPIWKGTVRTPDPEVMKWKILEDVLRIYENQLGRKLLNEAEITKLKNENNRRKLAKYFLGVYSQLPPKTRNDLDRRIGINRWADPQVGQAYTISSGGPSVPGKSTWNYHWAGVVMKSDDGRDNVTLENYSVSNPAVQNQEWMFQMYGSAQSATENRDKRGQTFHEEHSRMGTHGQNPTTMVAEGMD